ncbi:MAG TPA: hypothetical protein VF399_01415 [bacterium]
MSLSFTSRRTAVERKYFVRRKHYRPLRFVGVGIIVTIAVIYVLYRFMVR